MSDKKDLTRIEDLGEFVHELEEEDISPPDLDFGSEEVPDLPETESPFESDFSNNEETSFSTEESETTFGSDFNSDVASEFTTDFSTDSDPFSSSSEFNTTEAFPDSETEEDPFGSSETSSLETETISFGVQEETSPEIKEDEEDKEEISSEIQVAKTDWEAPLEEAHTEPTYTPSSEFKAPENFEDLKKFSESSNFTGMATEGNPSFSVLIKNLRYIEDVNDIVTLLKELSLMNESEEQLKSRLMRGTHLIPRISEYAAIYLAHKLRRFDIDIQIGHSDEIHPPKHQESPELGMVSKFNLYQNQSHHFHFDDPKLELSQIIVAATPSLEGYQVLRYMGVASEHKMLEGHVVEDEGSDEVPRHYQELAQKLKAHALKAHSNAVVGLNYQLTPIPSEFGMGHKYRLTCTGNLVWVNKL